MLRRRAAPLESAAAMSVAELATERRVFVPIEAIPRRLQAAFVSAEDQRFWEHHGVDPIGIIRAALTAAGSPAPLTRATLEDANLRASGLALIDAALARAESRGAHHRTDHPHPSASAYRVAGTRKVAVPC